MCCNHTPTEKACSSLQQIPEITTHPRISQALIQAVYWAILNGTQALQHICYGTSHTEHPNHNKAKLWENRRAKPDIKSLPASRVLQNELPTKAGRQHFPTWWFTRGLAQNRQRSRHRRTREHHTCTVDQCRNPWRLTQQLTYGTHTSRCTFGSPPKALLVKHSTWPKALSLDHQIRRATNLSSVVLPNRNKQQSGAGKKRKNKQLQCFFISKWTVSGHLKEISPFQH